MSSALDRLSDDHDRPERHHQDGAIKENMAKSSVSSQDCQISSQGLPQLPQAAALSSPRDSQSTLSPPEETRDAASPGVQTSKQQQQQQPPPPDGGLIAWLQVLAGHLVLFNVWGYMNSFGIFQGPYEQELGLPPSTVSWIGSVQVFLVFFLASVSGRALDAGHYTRLLWVGTALQLVGVFATSLATRYWQIFLAQGVCQALGSGLFFGPSMALVSTYFARRRTFAISLVSSGSATGGIVFPLMARSLLPRIGLAWTTRAMGLVILLNSAVVLACARPRLLHTSPSPPKTMTTTMAATMTTTTTTKTMTKMTRIMATKTTTTNTNHPPLFDLAAFREPPFALFAVGAFFVFWGTYYAYYYARAYAVDALGAGDDASFELLMLLSAVGLPGRVLFAVLVDSLRLRPLFVLAGCVLAGGLLLFAWAGVRDLAADFAWAALFGFFNAALQGLFPAACASLVPRLDRRGARIGLLFAVVAVACLTGPPLAGRLLSAGGGDGSVDQNSGAKIDTSQDGQERARLGYLGAQMWGGASLVVGSVVCAAAGLAQRRQERRAKVEEGENGSQEGTQLGDEDRDEEEDTEAGEKDIEAGKRDIEAGEKTACGEEV